MAPESANYDHKLPIGQAHGRTQVVDSFPQSKDLKEITDDNTAIPRIRSVAMRDMGTEMTPMTSQEPSRTATSVGSITPIRSPTSSLPSTPRRAVPAPTPLDHTTDEDSQFPVDISKKTVIRRGTETQDEERDCSPWSAAW